MSMLCHGLGIAYLIKGKEALFNSFWLGNEELVQLSNASGLFSHIESVDDIIEDVKKGFTGEDDTLDFWELFEELSDPEGFDELSSELRRVPFDMIEAVVLVANTEGSGVRNYSWIKYDLAPYRITSGNCTAKSDGLYSEPEVEDYLKATALKGKHIVSGIVWGNQEFKEIFDYEIIDNPFAYGKYIRIYAYLGKEATVSVPDTIDGFPVDRIDSFGENATLTDVSIPIGVEILNDAFDQCKLLCNDKEWITVSGHLVAYRGNAAHVVAPEGICVIEQRCFADHTEIEDLTLPEGLTDIRSYAFQGCSNLKAIHIPSSLLRVNRWAFAKCGIESLQFPETMESIDDYAFQDCLSLRTINIAPGTKCGDKLLSGFSNSLEARDDGLVVLAGTLYGVKFSKHKKYMGIADGRFEIVIPPDIKAISDCLNYPLDAVDSFTITEKLRNIHPYAFMVSGIKRFRIVDSSSGELLFETDAFSKLPNGTVVGDNKRFENFCKVLKAEGVAGLLHAQGKTNRAKSEKPQKSQSAPIEIVTPIAAPANTKKAQKPSKQAAVPSPASDTKTSASKKPTSVKKTPSGMKHIDTSDCKISSNHGLMKYNGHETKIILPTGITWIGKSAFAQSDITAIEIPEGVSSIAQEAFTDCEKLQSIIFPSTLKKIGFMAFSGCKEIISIDIPDSCTEIDMSAFSYCEKLANLHLPAKLKKIETHAFNMCRALKTVVIPDGCVELGKETFAWCDLKEVYIPSSVRNIGDNIFGTYRQNFPVVHTPKGSQAEAYAKMNGIKVDNKLPPKSEPVA